MWVHMTVKQSKSEPDKAVGSTETICACAAEQVSVWHDNVLKLTVIPITV